MRKKAQRHFLISRLHQNAFIFSQKATIWIWQVMSLAILSAVFLQARSTYLQADGRIAQLHFYGPVAQS